MGETLSKLNMPKGSGLTKPLNLSTELATLLGEKKGAQLSRPEVVKKLCLHQGEEAPGPRQHHGAHLWEGEGESFRYGEAPEGSPHRLVLKIRTFRTPPSQNSTAQHGFLW